MHPPNERMQNRITSMLLEHSRFPRLYLDRNDKQFILHSQQRFDPRKHSQCFSGEKRRSAFKTDHRFAFDGFSFEAARGEHSYKTGLGVREQVVLVIQLLDRISEPAQTAQKE